ncbi:MAG: hypothetical protein INQ03_11855 [Candidatus Heimdallarchaeota archaeon]|nr:hypothetical protein [Candidatus Heimdallarchaeota archaeon]
MSYNTSNETNSSNSGGYRLKFHREEFLQLLEIAQPTLIYNVRNFYYFSYDGFVMYCENISSDDLFKYRIIKAIEFSNYPWTKR